MAALRRAERKVYHLQGQLEARDPELLRVPALPDRHPQLSKQSHYLSGDNEPPQPHLPRRAHGPARRGADPRCRGRADQRRALPGLSAEQQRQVYYYALLPNLLLNLHPDYVLTFAIWPQAVDRTEIVCEWHFHPDEIARPDFDPQGAIEFWDVTNRRTGSCRTWPSTASPPWAIARDRTRTAKSCCWASTVGCSTAWVIGAETAGKPCGSAAPARAGPRRMPAHGSRLDHRRARRAWPSPCSSASTS